MHKKQFLFSAALLFLSAALASGDTIVMKDGKRYEGKITLTTNDLVKIEVPITEKIKETKTLLPADIAEIIKTAPDDEDFAKIQNLLPTQSLLTAEDYRKMISTGPQAFLTRHPGSKHQAKVEAMKTTLEEELDKVERGGVKIDNRWYTREEQFNFKEQIEAQKILVILKAYASRGRYDALIPALREFEKLEKGYFGTPAHAESLVIANEIIPSLGNQVQGLRRDVDVRNAKWEADKNALSPEQRFQVENARKAEDARFASLLEADKKAQIKWIIVNPNSPADLDALYNLSLAEYGRLKGFDPKAVKARAAALVEADELIAKGDYTLAQAKLTAATAMPVVPVDPNNPKRSSSSYTSTAGKSYASALAEKLKARIEERKKLEKEAEAAKKAAALAAKVEGGTAPAPPGTQGAAAAPDQPATNVSASDLDALLSGSAKSKSPEGDKSKSKAAEKAKSPPRAAKPIPDDDDLTSKPKATSPPAPIPSDEGFSLSMGTIIFIATGLLIVVIVILKILGIGGKKEDA